MAITKRGNSWQVTIVHKGERYRRQFTNETDAKIWEAEARASVLRGEAPSLGDQAKAQAGKPRTMKELLDHTSDVVWRGSKAEEKTLINARLIVGLLGPHTDARKVDGIAIDGLVRKLRAAGNANATINRKMSALSVMLKTAKRLDVVASVPELPHFKETEKRRFRFTQDHERAALAFFNRIGANWMMGYVTLSLDTGLRQGEALALRWSDVGDEALTVFETKGGKNRVVPLTTRLQSQMAFHRKPDGRVLDGVTKRQITYTWNKLRDHLGIDEPSFVPHILRHEFCSRLADAGVNATAIMRLAGHSSLQVTQRYVNMSPAGLVDAMRALEPPAAPALRVVA